MQKRLCFLLMFFLLLCNFVSGQENRRQTVGVVLGGGGARGLAHLGVLRALEEANIPIDYICGTSMGAIVGGLYASGYSLDEISKLFYSDEFQYWVSGKVEEEYTYYYKKKKPSAKIFGFSLDVEDDFKLQIPTSVVDPVQMDYAFMEIFSGATKVSEGNFDSLMIPFFCVTADIESSKASIRREGDLGQAIRASMSFPFMFEPITIDGKIMFDGGMYNNFPANEMLENFNPDIVIGVKVAGNFAPPKEGNMRSYLENMLTQDSDYKIDCQSAVLIEPNLTGISIMAFDKMKECERLGYEAGEAKIKEIRKFLLDSIDKDELTNKRKAFNDKKPNLEIKAISVQGVEKNKKNYVSYSILQGLDQSFLTTRNLKRNYIALYADRNIKDIQPKLYYNNFFKAYVLNLNVKTTNYLNFDLGGHLSTSPTSFIYAGVNYNFLNRHAYYLQFNTYLGRYYNSYSFMGRIDFAEKNPFYVEVEATQNNWNYYRLKKGIMVYSPINYIEQSEQNAQISFGMPMDTKDILFLKFGLGKVEDKYFNKEYITSLDTNDRTRFQNLALSLTHEHNSLDAWQYPTKGYYQRISIQYVNGKERFYSGNTSEHRDDFQRHNWVQMSARSRMHIPFNSYYTLGLRGDVFYSFQDLFLTYKSSLLNAGSYTPTIETLTNYMPEYRANQYAAMGVENIFFIDNMFGLNLSARVGTYLFLPFRQIETRGNDNPFYGEPFKKLYFIANTSFVARTPIGPFNLTFSYHQRDGKQNPWSVSFGFGFVIFNNRNIDR
jgi:NTE family protein